LSNKVSEQENFGGGERLSKIAFKERERHAKSLKHFARFATGFGIYSGRARLGKRLAIFNLLHIFDKEEAYLFLMLVLEITCSVTWDNKGNLIRPQRVSASYKLHIC